MAKHTITGTYQTGNVLFLILIAVALFAALSYAITKSNRGKSNAEKDKLALVASEMMQDASLMSQAIQRLMIIKHCSDTDISVHYDWDQDGSLENNGDDNYNSSAPSDKHCHLFDSNGAGLTWKTKPHGLNDSDIRNSYRLEGNSLVVGFGDDARADLIYTITLDNTNSMQELCNIINKKVGLPEDLYISANYSWFPPFRGTYSDPPGSTRQHGNAPSESAVINQHTGCFRTSHTGTYFVFFHVVHAR